MAERANQHKRGPIERSRRSNSKRARKGKFVDGIYVSGLFLMRYLAGSGIKQRTMASKGTPHASRNPFLHRFF
jgi:hypothetical protein